MSRSIIADDRDQNTQQLNRFRKGSFHWIRLADTTRRSALST